MTPQTRPVGYPVELVLTCAKTPSFIKSLLIITIMVKFMVVSEYATPPLPTKAGVKKIDIGRPLYDLEYVRSVAKKGAGLVFLTKDCVKNVQALAWGQKDVFNLLCKLDSGGRYRNSEWCESGNGAWAACDAYRVKVQEWVPTAGKAMTICYFVKFAINNSDSAKKVLIVSCHL